MDINEKYLEFPECCEVINLVGAQRSSLNQLYFQSERVVSNRPLFIDSLNEYAVWFDGRDDWMVGSLSNIDEGKLTTGFIQNDEMVDCPIDSEEWKEWYSGSWDINSNIYLECYGKCIQLNVNRNNIIYQ